MTKEFVDLTKIISRESIERDRRHKESIRRDALEAIGLTAETSYTIEDGQNYIPRFFNRLELSIYSNHYRELKTRTRRKHNIIKIHLLGKGSGSLVVQIPEEMFWAGVKKLQKGEHYMKEVAIPP